MSNTLIVTPNECVGLSWHPPVDVSFATREPLIPMHAGELASAATTMPLAALKEGERWRLVGVCGAAKDHNLFVRQGKWLGAYRPQWLNTWPLEIIEMGDKGVLALKRDSGVLGSDGDGGESFFNADGQPRPALAEKVEWLKASYSKQRATEKALSSLYRAELLIPWPKNITQPLGLSIEGLHMVDEKALAGLPDEAFLTLRRAQALPLAYALNLSLAQTHLLARLQRVNGGHDSTAPENLDEVFGEDDDFTFDFDS